MRIVSLLALAVLLAGCMGSGDAGLEDEAEGVVVIPRIGVAPIVDNSFNASDWAHALRLEGEFLINDSTPAAGVYPFRLWLGADEAFLFLAVEMPRVPSNPWSIEEPDRTRMHPDTLDVFLAMGHGGALRSPSDMVGISNLGKVGAVVDGGYWNGEAWVLQREGAGSRLLGGAGRNGEALFWEAAIPRRSSNVEHDGFQLEGRGDFRMDLMFFRQAGEAPDGQSPDGEGLFRWPLDNWPSPGYSPRAQNEPATWLKLRLGF